ncbi:hypothetical protein ZIOFF_061448 [Zingiber officinale]|uniref:RIN4 pathogenic type III effector avirulence factor Avr cleavage site domain-containing protein n=1 Tax=Zingiber officinale TaxID=94328 RepID=A0A8J5K9U3_ZINOF|nr:hypothetical protein ZIOFF_061448 [Zingiber officinale]
MATSTINQFNLDRHQLSNSKYAEKIHHRHGRFQAGTCLLLFLILSGRLSLAFDAGFLVNQEDHSASGWMSVPAFGEWDSKNGVPDYSMDFTKIREMRKNNKNPSRASLGNEEELNKLADKGAKEDRCRRSDLATSQVHRPIRNHHHGSPSVYISFYFYLNPCVLIKLAGEEEVYGLLPVLHRRMSRLVVSWIAELALVPL